MTHLFKTRIDGIEGDNIPLPTWKGRLAYLAILAVMWVLTVWLEVTGD